MGITREQLVGLSQWEPVHPDFGNESDVIEGLIHPFLHDLQQKNLGYTVIEDGGLTNYYAIWVRQAVAPADYKGTAYFTVPGVTVYLSLLGPYAAVGRVVGDYFSKMQHLGHGDLFDPEAASSELETGVVESLAKTRYTMLKMSELAERVPEDIRPYDCWTEGPHTVFDIVFSKSD